MKPQLAKSPTGNGSSLDEISNPKSQTSTLEPPAPSSRPQSTVDKIDAAELLKTLTAFKKGDFSIRLPVTWSGLSGKIADTLNEIFQLNEAMAKELERVQRVVGKQGKLSQRASLGQVPGEWASLIDSINTLI